MGSLAQFFNLKNFINQGLIQICIVIGITSLGIIIKKLFHFKVANLIQRSKWKGDDLIFFAVESQIIFWFFLSSIFIVLNDLSIAYPYKTYISIGLKILLIASITQAIARLIEGIFRLWTEKRGGGFPSTTIFTNIVSITIYTIGLLIVLDALNISIAPMLTALGVGGLAVSLALKDTLSDVFAGLHILLSKKVQPGDFVSIDSGEMGYIQNISWRNTKMLERSNNIIHIPNAKLSSAIIKNYDSGDPSFSVKIPVSIGYESNLDLASKIIIEVANDLQDKMDEINKGTEPSFKFRSFGESGIDLAVYFRCNKYGDQNPIIHEFIKKIHKRFEKEGINIPFPTRTIINHQK